MNDIELTNFERVIIHGFLNEQKGNLDVLRKALNIQAALDVTSFGSSASSADLAVSAIRIDESEAIWLLGRFRDNKELPVKEIGRGVLSIVSKLERTIALAPSAKGN